MGKHIADSHVPRAKTYLISCADVNPQPCDLSRLRLATSRSLPARVTVAKNGPSCFLRNLRILGKAVVKTAAISSPVRFPAVNTKAQTP